VAARPGGRTLARDDHGPSRELRPDDAILSEEGKDDEERLRHRRVWVVDPLDGTREYGEPPRDDWAVHVALCIDGLPVAGSVALPAQGRVLTTATSFPDAPPDGVPLRMVASRTRAPAIVTEVAAALHAELVYMGSAGAKAMTVVSGEADVYLHAGGQYEWDQPHRWLSQWPRDCTAHASTDRRCLQPTQSVFARSPYLQTIDCAEGTGFGGGAHRLRCTRARVLIWRRWCMIELSGRCRGALGRGVSMTSLRRHRSRGENR